MYVVLFRAEVLTGNEARVLSRSQQREMVRVLQESPRQQKVLTGDLRGCYRYRCGAIRVVYRVDETTQTVVVIAIGQRRDSEIYDEASKRV